MRKFFFALAIIVAAGFSVYMMGCNSNDTKDTAVGSSETKTPSKDEMIKTGDYIVKTSGCLDCHSPKIMTAMGPEPDSTKLLSGSPANEPMPALDANAGKPGGWIYMAPDVTAFVGPWGISYAANITPDSTTGIGAWTEEQFINTIRNGKHLGNGRPILPPMPWEWFGRKTDNDLKAIFAFLKSLPPIVNKVHEPVAPPDLMKMTARK